MNDPAPRSRRSLPVVGSKPARQSIPTRVGPERPAAAERAHLGHRSLRLRVHVLPPFAERRLHGRSAPQLGVADDVRGARARGRSSRTPHRRRAADPPARSCRSSRTSPRSASRTSRSRRTPRSSRASRVRCARRGSSASTSRSTRSIPTASARSRAAEISAACSTGIDAAIDAGFAPIKLNTVVLRGVNDDELERILALGVGAADGAALPRGHADRRGREARRPSTS